MKRQLPIMPAHCCSSNVSSSSSGALSEPSDGGTRSGDDGNSYYSEGFGFYRPVPSVLTSLAGTTTAVATKADTTSAVGSLCTNAFSDVLKTLSAYSHASASLRNAAPRPTATGSDAAGRKTAKGAGNTAVANHSNKGVGLALGVADRIHTVPIAVPLPPEEVQRRRREGGLAYPSRLTFRSVSSSLPVRDSDGATVAAADQDGTGKGGEGAKLGADASTAARAHKTCICCCCCFRFRSEKAPCKMKRNAAMRQRPHYSLRSHHVSLVSFRTMREHGVPMEGVQNVVPSVNKGARYGNLKAAMMGIEAHPKKLQKAIQSPNRPASGLYLDKSYGFGHGARGAWAGAGQSAFMRDGDPEDFWIAQLHRDASVRLEPIEIA
ncbi:hypothetical protein, unknown function [Leishmania tarentolae]|uniref:Uncharacterized protein n=1 Tax=Leishmania tarentolae TaxID=5689 RepID=A0A640KDU6_LEITA|nr:hypothetical protein, unknown function [Leishmania tarentolae]